MTVIATDGISMAADGLCMVSNAVISLTQQKIRRLRCGALVGCAGESTEAAAFTESVLCSKRTKRVANVAASDGTYLRKECGA